MKTTQSQDGQHQDMDKTPRGSFSQKDHESKIWKYEYIYNDKKSNDNQNL